MFENFISLGYYCGVAASMSKLGIRNCSGPFDWYISGFEGVLECIEKDFYDFLDINNLEVVSNGIAIRDRKHDFHLGHEIKVSFEKDYDAIYQKYMRRIDVFREQIKKKTCFIRAVRDSGELLYIQNNMQDINRIIKRQNVENEIIYIVSNSILGSWNLTYPFFVVTSSYEGKRLEEIRKLFDNEKKLQGFCIENFDEKKRYQNMIFDLQKESRRIEYRYWLVTKIETMDFDKTSIPNEIIIYGAGTIGKVFYHKIKNMCKVLFFLDSKPQNDNYGEGVPVIQRNKMNTKYSGVAIIITPCYEYQEIKAGLIDLYGDLNIIPLTDLLR